MSLLLRNFYILDGSMERARRADVLIEGEKIAKIGSPWSLESTGGEEEDGKGAKLLLPGFFNAHGHAAMTLLRGLGEERPLMEWLSQKIWPIEAFLTPEVVYAGTMQAIAEMASTGTTGYADMYYFADYMAKAVNDTGMRASVGVGVKRDTPEHFRDSVFCSYEPFSGPKIINSLDPHAPYTVPFEFICQAAEEAAKRGLPLQMHFLEAPWERGNMFDTLKMTPVEYLEKSGLAKVPHLVLAHCVQIGEEEIEFFASHPNITPVHCPASNLKLGSGFAPVPQLIAKGAHVALGTDGAASNNQLDMWSELRLASLIHKGFHQDPMLLTASQLLDMATYQGARAFGFDTTGRICEGWTADLSVVDLSSPHYLGADEENMATYVVYAGSSADVLGTMSGGQWIVKDRQFLPCPLAKIAAESKKSRNWLISQHS